MAQINKPSDYFNTKLWTGDNTDKTISGVGFQPDWVWWKQRNGTDDHRLLDSVRGEGSASYKLLFSSGTYAEFDGNDNGGSQGNINAITSDGFSGVQGTTGWNNWNGSGLNYVGWNWLGANGTASNTDGSITSSVSANTTSGFSIVSYIGTGANATVGHGLGVAPKMVIIKNRDSATNWLVYHASLGNANSLVLNTTGASFSSGDWQNTTPSSSIIYLSGGDAINKSGSNQIAYCFADVQGFSKMGSYTGNGSTDGTFVYTGFKPSFILFKKTTGSAGDWQLWDNKRDPINPVEKAIHPNANGGASTDQDIDFLSNGFKIRSFEAHLNGSGVEFIYMAFAEEPLVGDNPATAR